MPFDLVKNEIYDRQATEVMSRVLSVDSNCIDIGCHKGDFLRTFLKYAPEGRHFAFEPIPQLADCLRVEFPSVQVFDLALSDTSGEASFYVVPAAPALSGLHRRDFIRHTERRQEIRVKTDRLDAIVPTDTKIDLIKIDVEGAEGLVIAGALDTIVKNRPFIILEHGMPSSAVFGTTSEDIYDLLVERCGLRISLLRSWLSRTRPLTKREFVGQSEWYFLAHPAH
jgi:FkbM family methyltransferase